MKTKNQSELVTIIDMSGSMHGLKSDAIGGFNSFLEAQKEENPDVLLTVIFFNDKVTTFVDSAPIQSVNPLTSADYQPNGMTAMYDAIGSAITNRTCDKCVVAILTDGQENSSREWTREAVSQGISQLTGERGWKFLFLAANMDAWEVGNSLNINHTIDYAATKAGVEKAYRSMSITTSTLLNED